MPDAASPGLGEAVNPWPASTHDAAASCGMAARGRITGGLPDAPPAFDDAISAAARRGIVADVAGRTGIPVVPDLEAGSMPARQPTLPAGAGAEGVVQDAAAPFVPASTARPASCVTGVLVARPAAA